jgi:signal transduction histidine kinase
VDERGLVLEFAAKLVKPQSRMDEVQKFCAAEGLQTILLFIFDREVGAFLSAPGFPQTLPNARQWREILAQDPRKAPDEVMLPWPAAGEFKPAAIVSAEDYLLVIVGRPRQDLLAAFRAALPLLGAALKGERAALSEAAQAKLANETARQANALALGLDKARRDIQRELAFRREAEEQVRKRTAVLEALNRTGATLAAEFNLEKIVRIVIEAGVKITMSEFGTFLAHGQRGAPQVLIPEKVVGPQSDEFAAFANPNVLGSLWNPNQRGQVIRDSAIFFSPSAEQGHHLTTRSFLAAPVVSSKGEILGSLVFGHSKPGVFTDDAEEVIVGLASAAGIAISNANLYEALNQELEEHRRAETDLKNIRDDLEQRVNDRTASLEQAMMQMEEFSYTISHDLRTPLRAMTGYASVLLSDYSEQLDETGRMYIERIKRASLRMERLTLDLLAYSRVARLNTQSVVIEPAKVVEELLEHYVNLQEPAATIRIDGELPALMGHESAFGQVLTNLLTNAVKFVPKGRHPTVIITAETRGEFGRVIVTDNGIGVSPAKQGRLFRMFERLHPNKSYEGNGIGLAIVRKAVEKMGGRVGIESDGENGSSFWFELPLAK